jgi:hypothetical protein
VSLRILLFLFNRSGTAVDHYSFRSKFCNHEWYDIIHNAIANETESQIALCKSNDKIAVKDVTDLPIKNRKIDIHLKEADAQQYRVRVYRLLQFKKNELQFEVDIGNDKSLIYSIDTNTGKHIVIPGRGE